MTAKLNNSCTNLMVLQQQYNHQKKLTQIYAKKPSITHLMGSQTISRHGDRKKQKINEYATERHLKNIKKLVQNITQERSMLQRQKDLNDFFVYPALFFRETTIPLKRTKSYKNLKAKKTHIQDSGEKTPIISIQKIKHFLPTLHGFEHEDLEEWLDGVSKLIITFNIMQKDELIDLSQKIISLLPKKCPQDFRQAVQQQLLDICRQA